MSHIIDFSLSCEREHPYWKSQLTQALLAWQEIEWLSIAYGLRRCALATINVERIKQLSCRVDNYGISILPIAKVAKGQSYQASIKWPMPGEQYNYLCAIGASNDVSEFKDAWENNNNELIGSLLGYPKCCRTFFKIFWEENKLIDTTWQMSIATDGAILNNNGCVVKGPLETNVMLRGVGLRSVLHLPCNHQCEKSIYIGEQLLAIGNRAGFNEQVDFIKRVLSLPVLWSAIDGIAEIETSLFKFRTLTDHSSTRMVVKRTDSRKNR
ncbi:MAG: hypothetical protein HZA22_08185 [Nitrospirae bacterium]|nr:hypothetical protein [Nitrospirota bacterium]